MNLFPLAPGNRWTYSFSAFKGDRVEFELRASEERDLGDLGKVLAWPLENPLDEGSVIVPCNDGVRVYRDTWVGPIGRPTTTLEAEYHSGEPSTWEFRHAGGGCVVTTVTVTRRGVERVTVPAGTFDCLRFDFIDGRDRNETHWLCDGLGLVKRINRQEESTLDLVETRLL